MEKIFKPEEIEQFVKDHIQEKIDNDELRLVGLNMNDKESMKRELEIYGNALFEGICNGIVMCDGKIEGINV